MMQDSASTGVWVKTNVPNLYRHKLSQRYYVRVKVRGKDNWKSLKTTLKSVAEAKMAEHIDKARAQREAGIQLNTGKLTFGDLAKVYEEKMLLDPELRPNTKAFRQAGLKLVLKTWPEVEAINVRKISTPMVRDWSHRLRAEAKPYVPRGARRPSRNSTGASATTVNCAIDAVRHVLDVAVEGGYVFTNAARQKEVKRARPKKKILQLPTREQFMRFVEAIRTAGVRRAKAAADTVQFYAYSGARKNEAKHFCWKDVDLARELITLRETKNGVPRVVPMIAELKSLLTRMLANAPSTGSDAAVLEVVECQVLMDRAAAKVAMPRITHHDLRHLFATTCLESGVDVRTVAEWLGHQDHGALALEIYSHVRNEHSKAAAAKVSFRVPEKPSQESPMAAVPISSAS